LFFSPIVSLWLPAMMSRTASPRPGTARRSATPRPRSGAGTPAGCLSRSATAGAAASGACGTGTAAVPWRASALTAAPPPRRGNNTPVRTAPASPPRCLAARAPNSQPCSLPRAPAPRSASALVVPSAVENRCVGVGRQALRLRNGATDGSAGSCPKRRVPGAVGLARSAYVKLLRPRVDGAALSWPREWQRAVLQRSARALLVSTRLLRARRCGAGRAAAA